MPDTAVTSKTIFFAASTTKAFTAAAVALLVADNEKYPQVQWTTPVCELIRDDFVLQDEWATNHLTLEDLLTHRTGMPSHDRALGFFTRTTFSKDKPRPATKETVRLLRHLPATKEPRTTFQYNNIMYDVAQHVIETLTGQWLGAFLRERIWLPLGMTGTYFGPEDASHGKEDLASGYYYDEDIEEYVKVANLNETAPSGAGAIISNAEDYTKWIRAVLTRSDVLPQSAWNELLKPRMLTPETAPFTGPYAYCLGWRTGVYHGHRFYQHSGGLDAYSTWVVILPDLEFGVVAFANTAGSGAYVVRSLAWHLVEEKLEIPVAERFGWNEQGRKAIKEGIEWAAKARETFYPGVSAPGQPCTLPLDAYAGKYFHPGYKELEIYVDTAGEAVLCADRTKATWAEHMTFEHVSRDYFVIKSDWHGDFAAFYPECYPAEFKIGADNKFKEVGIRWEESMGDGRIWFKRLE